MTALARRLKRWGLGAAAPQDKNKLYQIDNNNNNGTEIVIVSNNK